MKNGQPATQIALRVTKNGPGPKVREAKRAADHKNQGNNRSAEGRCRASGRTCYAVAAKTVKNRGALEKEQVNVGPHSHFARGCGFVNRPLK